MGRLYARVLLSTVLTAGDTQDTFRNHIKILAKRAYLEEHLTGALTSAYRQPIYTTARIVVLVSKIISCSAARCPPTSRRHKSEYMCCDHLSE